jgi:preprotein translocase subunit SecB
MIKGNTIAADFQFIGNRVSHFNLETNILNTNDQKVIPEFQYDYNVITIDESKESHFGIIELLIRGKAKVGKSNLFKFDLTMEGAFLGGINSLSKDKFSEMLELNGLVTLSQISRSFLLSVTSQSGINPPVRLPMINVVSLIEKKKSERDNKENK